VHIDLHGLTGLRGPLGVVIEDIDPEFERAGMARSTLQTDIELKLRQSRIVVREGAPYLYLNVNIVKPGTGDLVAYSIRLQLFQRVRLDRDPKMIPILATTWYKASVGTVGLSKLSQVREHVRDHVDAFINAYLAANPQ
jgi:hypothetical protein